MRFEWSQRKNRENIRRHGIDFADAVEAFRYPMLTYLDDRADYGEDRWIGIGLICRTVVVVVYLAWDESDRIRIISVRKALRHERERYEEEIAY